MEENEMVPKATMLQRLNAKQAKIDELTAKVGELQTKIDSAPDAERVQKRYDKLEQRFEALTSEYDAYKADRETADVLIAQGIVDPDDRDLVLYRYGKIDEDKRPALQDYIGADGAARKDRFLSTMFADADEPGAQPAPRGRTTAKGVIPSTSTGGNYSVEAVGSMTREERVKNYESVMQDLGY